MKNIVSFSGGGGGGGRGLTKQNYYVGFSGLQETFWYSISASQGSHGINFM